MTTIRIEAEEMLLEGYRLESKQIASGGQLISLAQACGKGVPNLQDSPIGGMVYVVRYRAR